MAKGKIIVEGAKVFCTNSVANNSKATAVPIKVTSQKKKLGKNKYFAQDIPIATDLDKEVANFNNGQAFGNCKTPNGPKPCLEKCKIIFKDYYENVDFNKSMKILLDSSTGDCPGYGTPGIIKFADSGQKSLVSQIDIKAADEFSIVNSSAQWETTTATATSVQEINITHPPLGKPKDTYYFIKEIKNKNTLGIEQPILETKIKLSAKFSGDAGKIIWALFKGTGTKDKIKTFVGIGATINLNLSLLFKNLDEGKYRIEAYAKNAGDPKCNIIIEYIKDQVTGIKAAGKSTIKNVPVSFKIVQKVNAVTDAKKILNANIIGNAAISPTVNWKVSKENVVLYDSENIIANSSLVSIQKVKSDITVTFKNYGKYTIEAYTNKTEFQKPHKVEFDVFELFNVKTITHNGSGLYRYNDVLEVKADRFVVDVLPQNIQLVQWFLTKDETRLREFEQSPVSKQNAIIRPINELLFNDARAGNNYFGKYKIEADGRYMTNRPDLRDTKHYLFEVIRNQAHEIKLLTNCPTGAIVKVEALARIPKLKGDERMIVYASSQDVIDNQDGTFTFTKPGEYSIAAYLTGDQTLRDEVSATIKVATPELIKALWAYNTGYKRTETGYKEESYGFVEIKGLENQTITAKIWVKGDGGSFFKEPTKYLLEEIKIALNDKGKGQFKITTNDKYKEKIDCVNPPTAENPNPKANIIFTLEMPTGGNGDISFSENMPLTNGKPVEGTKFIEVLDSNEFLTLTNEQKIKSIVFATEDGKNVQQTLTHQTKSHKIWVHTINMQDEELMVDVMTNTHSDCMTEADGIITAMESIKDYPSEKVGAEGLLELDFTIKEEYLTDAENNPVRFNIQVAKKTKDPADNKKDIFIFVEDQMMQVLSNVEIIRSQDLKTLGIKATKEDKTPFTKEEKIALRKKAICYKNTALMVEKSTLTLEAVENCNVIVEVDEMAEIEKTNKNKICECEARIRAFMRMLRVGEGTGELDKNGDKKDPQLGYTTAFGGNKITDLSSHPMKVYGWSSAAGAYQIMQYTYAWLGGSKLEWTGKYFKILDIYEAEHDYRKKYSINDYKPESQDRLCVCLMKDKKGLIELIINNKIEDAIRKYGSAIWASLPYEGDNSRYKDNKGELQPATPMKKCLEYYNTFLKDELKDISNLHLKKGFLGEFDYKCCNENNIKALEGKGWNIDIHLWSDRIEMGYGILVLKNDSKKEIWRTIVRAQGYSNKIGGSRTEQYADTPTGVYKFEKWRNDGSNIIYGPNHRLDMTYESGEAKAIGREEIQIHGGRQADDSNPYLWNTGGCLRVFDDAISTLKNKIEVLEGKSSKSEDHMINVNHTLKYDEVSKKYFTPEDYLEITKNSKNEDILKKGIINKKYYKNESNYYTDNLTN